MVSTCSPFPECFSVPHFDCNYANTNYTATTQPWYKVIEQIIDLTIDTRISSIGEYAFNNAKSLTTISWGSNIKTVETEAFSGCGIKEISIPTTVTSIKEKAFATCLNLTTLSYPNQKIE